MGNLLVTGIGGNVGQGILRNVAAFDPKLKLIGTDLLPITAGDYLCDQVYRVPAALDKDYIGNIRQICDKEKIDLIIPSTDVEGYALSMNRETLPCLAFSPAETNLIFWDKYQTWNKFSQFKIAFAASCLPSQWRGQFGRYVVKARKGQGSKDLHFNPADVSRFPDEKYVVQELYEGTEITTAFYVTKRRKLHGHITFSRQLQNGYTGMCEVRTEFDEQLQPILTGMIENFEILGSCNVQAIATADGKVHPFEINGRISGTNSIRSQFGFKDVQYTVEEYLLNKEPSQPVITLGSAVRILVDVIFPNQPLNEPKCKSRKHFVF